MRTLRWTVLLVALLPAPLSAEEEEKNNLNIICLKRRMERAVREMLKSTRHREAAELIHKILAGGTVLQADEGLYLPARVVIAKELEKSPPEVTEHLRTLQRTEVENAIGESLTAEELLVLADKFPFSGYRESLLLRAGDILFERGDIAAALRIYLRILNEADGAEKENLSIRVAFAAALTGKKAKALAYASLIPETTSCGDRRLTRKRLKQMLRAARVYDEEGEPVHTPCASYHSFRLVHPLERKFRIRFQRQKVSRLNREVSFHPLTQSSPLFRYFPAFEKGRLFLPTTEGVLEVNPENGSKLMMRPSRSLRLNDADMLYCLTLTENRIFISLPIRVWEGETFQGIPVRASIPQRGVAIFDKESRKFEGYLHDFENFKERFGKKKWSFPSPPVVRRNRAYCEIKTLGNTCTSYIAVFDLTEKSLLKAIPVCSNGVELTMFGYDAREPLSTPPTSDGENLYLVTNLGVVYAFSLVTENIIWLCKYSQMKIRGAVGYFPRFRLIHWTPRPPIIEDGVLLCTPLDSEFAYAFEADTGRILWRIPYNILGISANSLLGVCNDGVVLSGRKMGVVGLRSGKLKKVIDLPLRSNRGLGLVTDDEVIIPTTRALMLVDVNDESVRNDLFGMPSGNILATEGWLFVVSEETLHIYRQGEK